jgi:chemotaxis protein CheD
MMRATSYVMTSGPFSGYDAVKLGPGEFYVTAVARDVISTVLGSCVSACVRDPDIGIGGMNHFMLPHSDDGRWSGASAAMRFGNFAMERLINDILKRGGERRRLEVKIFGGASIGTDPFGIGQRNADYAERYFAHEGMRVLARDLKGRAARRLLYRPACGRAFIQELTTTPRAVIDNEAAYAMRLPRQADAGSVELFD